MYESTGQSDWLGHPCSVRNTPPCDWGNYPLHHLQLPGNYGRGIQPQSNKHKSRIFSAVTAFYRLKALHRDLVGIQFREHKFDGFRIESSIQLDYNATIN